MLVLVINYTGDRIHFGLAVERARKEGIKVGRVSTFMELLFIKTAFFIYLLAYVFVSCNNVYYFYFLCPRGVFIGLNISGK